MTLAEEQAPTLQECTCVGVAEAGAGKKPEVVTARLSGHRDPGYWETSRMLLESALCLALQGAACCGFDCSYLWQQWPVACIPAICCSAAWT